MQHCCAKQVGFDTKFPENINKYWINIGCEIAREWISILIQFCNSELIDIGFDIDFEPLYVGILLQIRSNLLEGLCCKILVSKLKYRPKLGDFDIDIGMDIEMV